MAKLSKKREMAIYRAVDEPIMDARIDFVRIGRECGLTEAQLRRIDDVLYRAGLKAAGDAVRAASGAAPKPEGGSRG